MPTRAVKPMQARAHATRELLITTAAVMDLVYAEYDDLYMEQLRSGTNVRVQAL